ncbi:MAG: hypothetical protein JJU11_15470 [Candidatus Sumerlaeia bacterium]|nr:hypothetical protein [Candidatus Sumerlaeia bacterium]
MPDDLFGLSMLFLIIIILISSFWHALFIKIAAALVVKSDISYGEAFQTAFTIAAIGAIIGGGGSYLMTHLAITLGIAMIDIVGQYLIFLVHIIAGIFIVSKMIKDEQLKPIGMKKGFLVWLVSYILWVTVGCLCCMVQIGI